MWVFCHDWGCRSFNKWTNFAVYATSFLAAWVSRTHFLDWISYTENSLNARQSSTTSRRSNIRSAGLETGHGGSNVNDIHLKVDAFIIETETLELIMLFCRLTCVRRFLSRLIGRVDWHELSVWIADGKYIKAMQLYSMIEFISIICRLVTFSPIGRSRLTPQCITIVTTAGFSFKIIVT